MALTSTKRSPFTCAKTSYSNPKPPTLDPHPLQPHPRLPFSRCIARSTPPPPSPNDRSLQAVSAFNARARDSLVCLNAQFSFLCSHALSSPYSAQVPQAASLRPSQDPPLIQNSVRSAPHITPSFLSHITISFLSHITISFLSHITAAFPSRITATFPH